MASRTSNFCLDAHDPAAQARWWADVLDDFRLPPEEELATWDDEECWLVGPDDRAMMFLKVPEPKTVKNRMHVCVSPSDRTREEEVERLLGLGATMVDDRRNGPDRGWAVLADPEGNEFCVLAPDRPGE
jgi:hypothetical protein